VHKTHDKNALVVGATGGIGKALATELANRGVLVSCLSRSWEGLDVTCEENVARCIEGIETEFDLVIVATGILSGGHGPEKSLNDLSSAEMAHLLAVNAIGPALVLKHVKRLLPRDRRSVFAVLSARVGSIGDNRSGGWYSYRVSKAALNQVIRTASIELRRSHKHLVCVAVHPGTVETEFTKDYWSCKKVLPEDAAANLMNVIETLGPDQSGQFLDWAGYQVPW
jgi:NAD(P)-dependent dehydrogenase (short-subunit alcohol dehydrogenase family)